MPPGAYNSRKLYYFYANSTPLVTNSETPYWTDTPSVNGTITAQMAKDKASRDMAIPKLEGTDQLRYFYTERNPHNIVEVRDNQSIEEYRQRDGICDARFSDQERSIEGKFSGCTKAESITSVSARRYYW